MASKQRSSSARNGSFRLSTGKLLKTTPVFDTYWRFACERQSILFKRIAGDPPQWTDDPILKTFRFTNVYRASDRVSQYLIRQVIYNGDSAPEEVFFRTILFKLFNRIDTWELLKQQVGEISWNTFDHDKYDAVFHAALRNAAKIYSPAYIMPCPALGAKRKHTNHLKLIARMMAAGTPSQITSAHSLEQVFTILRSFPSIGDFLAFQLAIDLNYSPLTNFSEMDFVVAGPGARSGIQKAFCDLGGLSEEIVIREVTEAAEREFLARGLDFKSLWGRPLQLIDCQNLFCEVDKYSRVAFPECAGSGRTRIKRRYDAQSAHDSVGPHWYPPKWNLKIALSKWLPATTGVAKLVSA